MVKDRKQVEVLCAATAGRNAAAALFKLGDQSREGVPRTRQTQSSWSRSRRRSYLSTLVTKDWLCSSFSANWTWKRPIRPPFGPGWRIRSGQATYELVSLDGDDLLCSLCRPMQTAFGGRLDKHGEERVQLEERFAVPLFQER